MRSRMKDGKEAHGGDVGGDPIDLDRLIRDDRNELLEGYGADGEKGKKRAAALFLFAGGEFARGATGLLGAKGLWLCAALIGVIGAGLIGLDVIGADPPQENRSPSRQGIERPVPAQEQNLLLPVETGDVDPVPETTPGRLSTSSPSSLQKMEEKKPVVSETPEERATIPSTPVEATRERQEEIRTRVTIDYGDE